MPEGWAGHPGGRHHGAHGAALARTLAPPAGGFLDFSQNVNPLGPPQKTVEAAVRAVKGESGRYPDLGYRELRRALGAYLGVPAGRVLPTNGGAEALFLAARLAAERAGGRGEALILEPTFSEYAAASAATGLTPVRRVVRQREHGFRLQAEILGDLEGVAVVFLCNPNNPTGDILSREQVLGLAGQVREAGAVLVVDEAFADFTPGASVAGLVDGGLLVARSLTKFFAIPGLRLGCLVCPEPAEAQRFQPSWSVNAPAAAAGVAAVGDTAYARGTVREVSRLRRRLLDGLNGLPGVEAYPGAANFLLARGPEGLVESLARRGVLVRGCEPFAGLGSRYLRVAVRGEAENARLLGAMGEAL